MIDPVKYALLMTAAYELSKKAASFFQEQEEPKPEPKEPEEKKGLKPT